jgi:hypothetical protein
MTDGNHCCNPVYFNLFKKTVLCLKKVAEMGSSRVDNQNSSQNKHSLVAVLKDFASKTSMDGFKFVFNEKSSTGERLLFYFLLKIHLESIYTQYLFQYIKGYYGFVCSALESDQLLAFVDFCGLIGIIVQSK